MAVRAPPRCRNPVGEGAKRTRTGPWMSVIAVTPKWPAEKREIEADTVSRGLACPQALTSPALLSRPLLPPSPGEEGDCRKYFASFPSPGVGGREGSGEGRVRVFRRGGRRRKREAPGAPAREGRPGETC